jgi:hypothetical protein
MALQVLGRTVVGNLQSMSNHFGLEVVYTCSGKARIITAIEKTGRKVRGLKQKLEETALGKVRATRIIEEQSKRRSVAIGRSSTH